MSLKDELKLKKPIKELEHEALLNIYYTASQLKNYASKFFSGFEITDVQFNLLLLLYHQSGDTGGLTQVEISDMMLVNRANVTSLVDRAQKAGFVTRTDHPTDRRTNIVRLTDKGLDVIRKVDTAYINEVRKVMSPLKKTELKKLIDMLQRVREDI